MNQDRPFYVVRGQARHGLVTHRCPTVEFALDSLKRFMREGMESITVLDPEGVPLTAHELEIRAGLMPPQKQLTSAEPA